MRFRHLLVILALLFGPTVAGAQPPVADAQARFDHHRVVRVSPRDVREMRTVLALTDDVWTCGFGGSASSPSPRPATIDVRLTPDAYETLRATNIPFTVMIENVQALIDAERAPAPFAPRGPGFFALYQDYAAVSAYMDTLVALRPDMVSRLSVGTSLGVNQIFAIRVSAPGNAPGSKPAVIVFGCQHAREWITVMATVYAADQLIRTYPTDADARRLLDNYEFYFVPIANPDGYLYTWSSNRLWRKNRRDNGDGTFGVDLNRNWGYQWGGAGSAGVTSDPTYRGTAPFSEPCSTALRNFIQARPNTVLAFDVHSYSQVILEPWAYDYSLPPDARAYTQMSAAMQSAMFAPAGMLYTAGPTYRILYAAAGGSHDWIAGVQGALAYGLELRDTGATGFLLPAAQIVPASVEAFKGISAAANWVLDNSIGASFPAGRPTWVRANTGSPVQVQFTRGLKYLGDVAANPPFVYTRVGRNGPFTASPLALAGVDEGGPVFTHTLPAGPCGGVTQWYYRATLPDASVATAPLAGAAAPFEAASRSATTLLASDFEADQGWTVGDTTFSSPDNATTGLWTRVDPNGTKLQPEFDATPLGGVNCYVTGQNARGDDNNGRLSAGKTTLNSPIFSAAPGPGGWATGTGGGVQATFWLWTYTSQTQSFWVDVSNNADSPTPTWTRAFTIDASSPINQTSGRWNKQTVRLSDLVAPSAFMKLRLVAQNSLPSTLYEAAVDEVQVVGVTCARSPCAGDHNADGVLSVQDIFDYLNDWFDGNPRADFNGSGLSTQDIFDFLNAWFGGC
ncbi:MAG TPA: M14 family metallocarboxypeptidase [Phycisphaerales bacterium]|nr:M14 family metallocarboxypeptidase [Phycisphaerales bacterium]